MKIEVENTIPLEYIWFTKYINCFERTVMNI